MTVPKSNRLGPTTATPASCYNRTVGTSIIAIGDELLSGFTLDTNSHWMSEQLRRLGFQVKRRSTVRDRNQDVAEQVLRDLEDPEVEMVFCSGGLGPTPDDRTLEAIALALGRELVELPEVTAKIERRVAQLVESGIVHKAQVMEGNRRMAFVPAGAEHVFQNTHGMAPGLCYRLEGGLLFILPGVPPELKGIFSEEIEPLYLGGRAGDTVRELRFRGAVEARFYPIMRELEATHADVSVGSYPNSETRELTIRASGADPERVAAAMEIVRTRIAAMGVTPLE